MKIKRVDFSKLRNNEHFQCQTEFKALVEAFNPATLNIEPYFSGMYIPSYNEEDVALVKIVKNSFTDERSDADRGRDLTFRGLVDTVNGALYHFDPVVQVAARRLKIVFGTYGNVSKLPLNEETSAIYNLVQDLSEKYSTEVGQLNIMGWVSKLKADNEAYEALVMDGYEEEAAKTELKAKETRTEVDKVVRQIIERIEALIVIEGDLVYTDFIRRLNIMFERYANTLAQRQGIAKAEAAKKKAAAETAQDTAKSAEEE